MKQQKQVAFNRSAMEQLLEIKQTVDEWENMDQIDRVQATLEGRSIEDHVLDHYKRYISAMEDHIKHGNPTWMTPRQQAVYDRGPFWVEPHDS